MTIPAPPATRDIKQTERPHPFTPFVRGWLVLVAFAFAFGRNLIEQGGRPEGFGRSGWLAFLPVVGLVAVLAAVAGLLSWYFTRFVIDDDELRVETGVLFKSSQRIAFERVQSVDLVQPLVARVFGLAELRIEVGSGDRSVRLRYLSRPKAARLRDYLLARAHGERATLAEAAGLAPASAYTDLSRQERRLVTIPPGLLVGAFLLSSEWLVSLLLVVVAFVATTAFGVTFYALPGLLPLLLGAVSLIGRRVIAQFNFTLAESPRGLRITRGLTNLTSQSVPVDRIQGVRVVQSLLWRPFGWYRVDVDVLGYAHRNEGDGNNSEVSSMLLPVATRTQTQLALSRVLPGYDLSDLPLRPAPRRVRWLRPLDFWTLRYGWTDQLVVAERGWLLHVRNLVPHAKTQSVAVAQGPLQRRLRLADVAVHTPRGPVNLVARQLDAAAARKLVLSQLDRAREARKLAARTTEDSEPAGAPVGGSPPGPVAVLRAFGLTDVAPLGWGGEAVVYPLDLERVLRVYRSGHEASARIAGQLRALYGGWEGVQLGIELPRILQIGEVAGHPYSIDRRMSGRGLTGWLAEAELRSRRQTLLSYLDVALRLAELPLPRTGFGRLVGEAPATFESLLALLDDQLARAWDRVGPRLDRDLSDASGMLARLRQDLAERTCEPCLVHGDYFPGNVFASRAADGTVVASGVGDFSPHTLAADPMMDVAGAVVLLQQSYPDAPADARWLHDVAVERLGGDTAHWIEVYRRYYAVYYGDDPQVYPCALAQLHGG